MQPHKERFVIFRPGVSKRRTAFENLLLLYRAVAQQCGASIQLIVGEDEVFSDSVLEVKAIPSRIWEPWRGRFAFPSLATRLREVRRLLAGADLVVTCDPLVYRQAELAIIAARRVGAPVWFEATVSLLTERNQSRWPHTRRNHRREMLAATERIVIPSFKVIERFAHHHLADAVTMAKFGVVGHPIDTNLFKPIPNARLRRVILCVSRLVPEKGLPYIIKAFQEVITPRPDSRLVVVGEGPMLDYLRNLCRSEPLRSTVEIRSNVPHEQLPQIYQAADVFVNHALTTPEWEEYFGVANLEAMSCGLPVIATRSGAIASVLSNRGKILWTEERDISGLAGRMLAALDLPCANESPWAREGHQFVHERYSPEACARRWLEGIG